MIIIQTKKENIAKLFLRCGLAFVFVWFGVDKFFHPDVWFVWIPDWFKPLLFVSETVFVYFLGVFETVLGLFVLVGLLTKLCAFIAAVFLAMIILSFGFNELMVRDAGLFFLALSLSILGAGKWSVDWRRSGKNIFR